MFCIFLHTPLYYSCCVACHTRYTQICEVILFLMIEADSEVKDQMGYVSSTSSSSFAGERVDALTPLLAPLAPTRYRGVVTLSLSQ